MPDDAPSGGSDREPEHWYHAAGESAEGPLRRGELLGLLARGDVSRSAPVWRPGMDRWIPAREVTELADLLPPPRATEAVEAGVAEGTSGSEVASPAEEDASSSPVGAGRRWTAALDLPVWGPVAGAAVLVGVAGIAAWSLEAGGAGVGAASGATTDSAATDAASDFTGGSLSDDHLSVARAHRAALADSLRRLPGGDSLLVLLDRGGFRWTRRMGFSGLERLPDRPLVDHAELMGKALAVAPDELCSEVAEWRATSRAYWRLLGGLSPDEMRRLLQVLRGGLMAELRGRTPWPSPSPNAVSAAFSMLGERLGETSRDSLLRVLAPEASPTPSESCWVERTLYGGVPRLPDPWRALLARAAVTG